MCYDDVQNQSWQTMSRPRLQLAANNCQRKLSSPLLNRIFGTDLVVYSTHHILQRESVVYWYSTQ